MANKKHKRDELWCQYGVQLHPRRVRNIISGPESVLFSGMMMSHVTSHRRQMWYRHVQLITLWIYGNCLKQQLLMQTQYLTHWKQLIWQINSLLPRWPSALIGTYVTILKTIKQGKIWQTRQLVSSGLIRKCQIKFDISRANWNLNEMTATQFCCNSVSCVMGDTSSRYWLDGDGDVTFFFNSARPSTHHEQLSFNHFHQGLVHQAHLTHTKLPKLCHYRQIGGRRVTNPKISSWRFIDKNTNQDKNDRTLRPNT